MDSMLQNLLMNLRKEKKLLTAALPSTDDAGVTDAHDTLETYITGTLDLSIEFLTTASVDDMKEVLPILKQQHENIDLPSYFDSICRYSSTKECDQIARAHEQVSYYLDDIMGKLSGGKRASKRRRRRSKRARSKRRR
jgi:hypothetical protein